MQCFRRIGINLITSFWHITYLFLDNTASASVHRLLFVIADASN